MLSDEVIEKVTERLINRIEQGNEYILKTIGENIKKIGTLSPSKAQELVQVLKYGGSYDKIVKKLAEITKLNVKDIYKIFEEVSKNDLNFARQFYKYRNKDFIPYEKNIAFKNQVEALSRLTAQEYMNITNTLAFSKVVNGRTVYTPLARMYQEVLDTAVLNVAQGKETFQSEMYRILKELGESGIRTVDYPSSRSIRLDSAIRMQMRTALRTLHNENQKIIGEEIDSDGIEISTHSFPADDHAPVQGRQFSNEEYAKLNDGLEAKDYKGNTYTLDHDGKNGYRPISTMNCYHYIFSIVLGVSKPAYTDKELKQIIDDNNKGFEYEGKHYTNYEGTQLFRKIETEVRKQKDTQILAKASGNNELIAESQQKITQLTNKYRELSKVSGLQTKMQRMRVTGYKRVAIKK